jgi:hypothetical protein
VASELLPPVGGSRPASYALIPGLARPGPLAGRIPRAGGRSGVYRAEPSSRRVLGAPIAAPERLPLGLGPLALRVPVAPHLPGPPLPDG